VNVECHWEGSLDEDGGRERMDCLVNVNVILGCVVERVESAGEVDIEGKNRSVISIPVKKSGTLGGKVWAMSRSHSPVIV
jgi:hypothetical protein